MVKRQADLRYDGNINGSYDHIAGLSNAAGNVFGLCRTRKPLFVGLSIPPGQGSMPAAKNLLLLFIMMTYSIVKVLVLV